LLVPQSDAFKCSGFNVFLYIHIYIHIYIYIYIYILTRDPFLETGVTFKLAQHFGQLTISNLNAVFTLNVLSALQRSYFLL